MSTCGECGTPDVIVIRCQDEVFRCHECQPQFVRAFQERRRQIEADVQRMFAIERQLREKRGEA